MGGRLHSPHCAGPCKPGLQGTGRGGPSRSRPDRRLARGAGGQARRKAWGHTQVWSGRGGGEIPRLSLCPSDPWPWPPRVPVSPDPVLGPSVEAATPCQASLGLSSDADSACFPPLPRPSHSPETLARDTQRRGWDGTSAWGTRSARRVQCAPWHPPPQAPYHKACGLGHGGEAVPDPLSHFWEAGRPMFLPRDPVAAMDVWPALPLPRGTPFFSWGLWAACAPELLRAGADRAGQRRNGTQNSQAHTGQNLYC